ncbi:hypothetical protein EUX98_g1598 [Antrodiella citrinella]|uniref:Uncharacterized protein n=1 Tax=Antrodiella citrinella TaxID=2447956 RepID=A0A4S4N400_9APHY|nr:hypothetical protein EUX98_g1598 [Antrodiella citrinella]
MTEPLCGKPGLAGSATATAATPVTSESTSIGIGTLNPATGTCTSFTSFLPTDIGIVNPVVAAEVASAATSAGDGEGCTRGGLGLLDESTSIGSPSPVLDRLSSVSLGGELESILNGDPDPDPDPSNPSLSLPTPTLSSTRFLISLLIPSNTESTAMNPPVRPTPAEQCSSTGELPSARFATPVLGSSSPSPDSSRSWSSPWSSPARALPSWPCGPT